MKKLYSLIMIGLLLPVMGFSQIISGSNEQTTTSDNTGLTWGSYGEIKYSQQLDNTRDYNAKLDVHRIVLLMGYNFNSRLSMVAEIEVEHVKEIYLEQAFVNYRFSDYFNLKGGLILMPVGIINELHEPVTFYGVNRPLTDKYIIPSTWREIGIGFTGNIYDANLNYQAYVVNGIKSYDDKGLLSASNGIRKGRQKGAESFMSSPNFTGKINYYGIPGLKIGLSTYLGKTESTLFNDVDESNELTVSAADSSVVGLSLVAADLEYLYKGLRLRGQYAYSSLSNTEAYNEFTEQNIGSSIYGYYVEAGFDLLSLAKESKNSKLIPFIRYENYNTQNTMAGNLQADEKYDIHQYTMGLHYLITDEFVVKGDFQMKKSAADDEYKQYVNLGFGYWF